MDRNPAPRPAIATFFGLVSLIWAAIMLGWVLIVIAAAVLLGLGSWLGGPVVGVLGTAIGGVVVLYCILSSLMSFVLLWAGWGILRGDPGGVPLLRLWAWASVVFDTLTLLLSGGIAPTSWGALAFAVAVIYFTRPAELATAWTPAGSSRPYAAKPRFTGDPDF